MKSIIKQRSKSVNTNTHGEVNHYRPGYFLAIKKSLNISGKLALFAIYTLAIIFSTLKYKAENTTSLSFTQKEALKQELLSEIKKDRSIRIEIPNQKKPLNIRGYKNSVLPKINSVTDNKIFKYSTKNEEILRFKHGQEYRKLTKSIERQREELISTIDLKNPNDVIRLDDFEANSKLELFTLKATHREIRNKFRKQKYLAINN